MSKNTVSSSRASSVQPPNPLPSPTIPNRVLKIDMEDVTDDDSSSGITTPIRIASIDAFVVQATPLEEDIVPSLNTPPGTRFFVSSVRIPIKQQTSYSRSYPSSSSGISSDQRMQLEEAKVYSPTMTKDLQESLAKRLDLRFDQVSQWYADNERGGPTFQHLENYEQTRTTGRNPGTSNATNKRQHTSEMEHSSDDDGILGSSTSWYQKLATPKVARPKAADTSTGHVFNNKLRPADVTRQLTTLLRGGAIFKEEDVKQFASIMAMTSETAGKRPLLNAILSTKTPTVLNAFMQSNGLKTMQAWLKEAVEDVESDANKELVLQCIRILDNLPFLKGEDLSSNDFGRIMKRLSNRTVTTPDDEIRVLAGQLVEKWIRLVREPDKQTPILKSTGTSMRASKRPATLLSRLNGFTDISALPSFTKVKSNASANTEKQKPKIGVNVDFFKEITPSAPTSKRQVGKRTGGKPKSSPSEQQKEEISFPQLPTPRRSKRGRDEEAAKEDRLSIQARPAVTQMNMPITQAPILPMTVTTPAPVVSKAKAKKTVRFKLEHELVAIREIESRHERDPEDWIANRSDSNDRDTDWSNGGDVDTDQEYHQESSPVPVQDRSMRPVFVMPENEITALVRGDSWYPPPLVSLAGVDVVPTRIVSTEIDSQATREQSTPPHTRIIQLSPFEPPVMPLWPTPVDAPVMPLYEAESVDHAPELRQALNVILQFLTPPPPYKGPLDADDSTQPGAAWQQKRQQDQFNKYRVPS